MREATSAVLGLGVLICFGREAVMFPGTANIKLRSPWFWPSEGSDFWSIGPRCFDLFWLRGNCGSRDGAPKITKPNHQEIVKRLGFARKESPYAILKLGSVILRLILGEASWFC